MCKFLRRKSDWYTFEFYIDFRCVGKIQPMNAVSSSNQARSDEDEPPKSVIHAPAGFGDFVSDYHKMHLICCVNYMADSCGYKQINGLKYSSSSSQSISDGAETLASNVVATPSVSTEFEQAARVLILWSL